MNPYLNANERMYLAKTINSTTERVASWFERKRKKIRRKCTFVYLFRVVRTPCKHVECTYSSGLYCLMVTIYMYTCTLLAEIGVLHVCVFVCA